MTSNEAGAVVGAGCAGAGDERGAELTARRPGMPSGGNRGMTTSVT